MTLLTLIRHGETEWNRLRLIQGSTDVPLNDTGRQQARDAAAALRPQLDLDAPVAIVASDLGRARETAEIIAAELGLGAPRLYPELRERTYGEAEGLDVDEFLARWGHWHTAEVPGAESWSHLRTRGVRALSNIVFEEQDDPAGAEPAASIVVVTHGAMIRELIRYATDGELPLEGERLANGSAYTMLLEDDRLELLSYAQAEA